MARPTKSRTRDAGEPKVLRQLAEQYSVPVSAVAELFAALERGGGRMAQFDHPDLGGRGQWMAGGLTMIGDMFNDVLKAKVDALCRALQPHVTSALQPDAPRTSVRSTTAWWPAELRSTPVATGGQNDFRYAYFPAENALVVDANGKVEVYDTRGHEFHGFEQQQGTSSRFAMRSARGLIELTKLPKRQVASKPK